MLPEGIVECRVCGVPTRGYGGGVCADCDDDTDDNPPCRLSGTDGNVFSIISTVSRCLKQAGRKDLADEWAKRAMDQGSYRDVIALASEYVRVG